MKVPNECDDIRKSDFRLKQPDDVVATDKRNGEKSESKMCTVRGEAKKKNHFK